MSDAFEQLDAVEREVLSLAVLKLADARLQRTSESQRTT